MELFGALGAVEGDFHRLGFPDFFCVFRDGAVGGEVAHAGDVEDRHSGPAFGVVIGLGDPVLGVDVGAIICEQEEGVVVEEVVDYGAEEVAVSASEVS